MRIGISTTLTIVIAAVVILITLLVISTLIGSGCYGSPRELFDTEFPEEGTIYLEYCDIYMEGWHDFVYIEDCDSVKDNCIREGCSWKINRKAIREPGITDCYVPRYTGQCICLYEEMR